MKIAIIGASGLVGREMVKVMEEIPAFADTVLLPAASERSVGRLISFNKKEIKVLGMEECLATKPSIALFSAGSDVSQEWGPKFAAQGCRVIDNSSAWRMDKDVPLIVPEINAGILQARDRIIANPNCSTIQLVMALAPLDRAYGLKRIVVSTYQSVSGSGIKGIQQLEDEEKGIFRYQAYPHKIHRNALPHGGDFLENDYTSEEMKLVNESRKILDLPKLGLTATVVRIPNTGGHSESVNVSFEKDFDIEEIRMLLSKTDGICVLDKPSDLVYPMPIDARHKNDVFVGRIRRDESQEKSLNMWIVADNLRKGAATNAVQIALYLINHKLLPET